MDRFDDIRERIPALANLTRLALSDADALRQQFPQIPEDYLTFLTEVGFGNLGELQLYSAPSRAGSIYSPMPPHLEQVIVFGDDMQGYCFGFDKDNGYRVVEIGPNGDVDTSVESDFTGLMRGYFE